MPRSDAQIRAEQARDEKWVNVQFRVTTSEYQKIKKKAGEQAVSGWARDKIRQAAGIKTD
jgi:hypothetical protein